MHWASRYLGLPWSATGEGPDAYHCWSFVRHVQAEHFGRVLPEIPYTEDLLGLARAFREHPERARWGEVALAEAVPGDVVLMRLARYPVHVGVWLGADGGGVLHCERVAGVVYQSLPALRQVGWRVSGVYRFKGGG